MGERRESTQPAPNNPRETRAASGSLLLGNGGFTQRGRGFFFGGHVVPASKERESGLGAVGGLRLCPSRGSPRGGGGGGRWGAPTLHEWPRLRPRPTAQGPDPKPVAEADGVFRGPKRCRRWDPVHGAGRGEALREGETGHHPPPKKQPLSVPVYPHHLDPWGHSVPNRRTVSQRQWEADSSLRASGGISPCIGNWQRLGRRL